MSCSSFFAGGRHRCASASVGTLSAFAALLCVVSLVGCAKDDRPPLGGVHGTVTLDGQPLAGAIVTFEPVEPGRASMARPTLTADMNSIYIRDDKGAKVGAHRVQITTGNANAGKPELLPPRYHSANDPTGGRENGRQRDQLCARRRIESRQFSILVVRARSWPAIVARL